MIQSLRQVRNRIKSIENTKKVTGAMEMISVAKLNRIDTKLFALRPYFRSLESLLNNLVNSQNIISGPFFEERPDKKDVCLCLITSDSGLCGLYNSNILSAAEGFINKVGKEKVKLVCVGRRGFNYFKSRGINIINSYLGLNGRYSGKVSDEISNFLVNMFLSRQVDEVYIAYTNFETIVLRKPTIKKFLNIPLSIGEKIEYILEPDINGILDAVVSEYILNSFRRILLEAFASEHSARAMAMKTATDNAKELLDDLVLLRNKVRQANITREMLEIIASSEALKG